MGNETLITIIALVLCMAVIVTAMLMLVAGVMLKPLEERMDDMDHDDLEAWRRSNPGTPIAPPKDDELHVQGK